MLSRASLANTFAGTGRDQVGRFESVPMYALALGREVMSTVCYSVELILAASSPHEILHPVIAWIPIKVPRKGAPGTGTNERG